MGINSKSVFLLCLAASVHAFSCHKHVFNTCPSITLCNNEPFSFRVLVTQSRIDSDKLFHRYMSPLLTEAGQHVSAEEDLPMPHSQDHTGVHISRPEARQEHQHQELLGSQQPKHPIELSNFTPLKPNIIEDSNPWTSPNRLQSEATLVDMEGHRPHTIKKSASNQELARSKWGTPGRSTSGRSKTGLQITVPDRTTPKSILTGPIFYDKSTVYVCSSSSSGSGRIAHSFGAIGDHRSPHPSPSSAPLASSTSERPPTQHPATLGPPLHSALHDLVESSVPDSDQFKLLVARKNIGSLTAASIASLEDDVPYPTAARRLATAAEFQHPTPHDLTDASNIVSDQHELLVVGKMGPLRQGIMPYRVAPSKLRFRTRRRRSMTDLKERPVTTPVHIEEHLAKPAHCQDKKPPSNIPAFNTALHVDGSFGDSEPVNPPTWRRSGPSFASSIRPSANPQQGPLFPPGGPESAIGDVVFQDRLDPEEFSLPYGVSTKAAKLEGKALI